MQTFIPGYMTEVTINGTDVTLIGQVVSYSDDQTAVPKPTFGKRYRRTIAGQGLYTMEVSGHLAAENVGELWAIRAETEPIAWTVQIGTATEGTDGGIVTGNAVVTNLSFDADAEGNWAWSMSLEGDDQPTYTPPAAP